MIWIKNISTGSQSKPIPNIPFSETKVRVYHTQTIFAIDPNPKSTFSSILSLSSHSWLLVKSTTAFLSPLAPLQLAMLSAMTLTVTDPAHLKHLMISTHDLSAFKIYLLSLSFYYLPTISLPSLDIIILGEQDLRLPLHPFPELNPDGDLIWITGYPLSSFESYISSYFFSVSLLPFSLSPKNTREHHALHLPSVPLCLFLLYPCLLSFFSVFSICTEPKLQYTNHCVQQFLHCPHLSFSTQPLRPQQLSLKAVVFYVPCNFHCHIVFIAQGHSWKEAPRAFHFQSHWVLWATEINTSCRTATQDCLIHCPT